MSKMPKDSDFITAEQCEMYKFILKLARERNITYSRAVEIYEKEFEC